MTRKRVLLAASCFFLGSLIYLSLQVVATRLTRLLSVACVLAALIAVTAFVWDRRSAKIAYLVVLGLVALFILFPVPQHTSARALSQSYCSALRGYRGVKFIWGGECRRGIDCSGLARRAFIDACVGTGLRNLDPALLRLAFAVWSRDASAGMIGRGYYSMTFPVTEGLSINQLHGRVLQPGDMAVVRDHHVLIYLGDSAWIQPEITTRRVLEMKAPNHDQWFTPPAKFVRWVALR
jgi:hypothetical protein